MLYPITNIERIAGISRVTLTVWVVVVDGTESMSATHSRARVFTLVCNTGQVTRTLLVACALRFARFARFARIALETGEAFTGGCIVPRLALGISTAW